MTSWKTRNPKRRQQSEERSMDCLTLPANYEIPTKPRTLSVNSSANMKSIRSVVLGKDGVGKSAFTVRLLTKRFIGEYDSSLEETYRHRVEVDGQNILLEILDTAGQNSVEKIDACSRGDVADVYYVLYSNTDRSSFKEAVLIVKYLVETRNVSKTSIFLIATKKDLKYQQDVTEYEGRLLAMELGCEFYIISSSEGYDGTQDVLRGSLRVITNHKHSKENSGSKSPLMRRVKNGLRSKSHSPVPSPSYQQILDARDRTATL
ncbi:ras-related and estrogen-regulated growth inhibitor-like isoform X1 [Montipora capricornis]|uniref:ras-related and estrogen-regulated growth inhibitor-like isoform X1 n=2 Tax=Montipora capricornis TaxID=246305 RepID=UPI0035F1D035